MEKQFTFLRTCPEYKIVYCNALHFFSTDPGRLLKKRGKGPSGDIFNQLLQSSLINPNTIMLSRDVLMDGLMFPEGQYGRYSEEWDLYLRLSGAGYEFGYLDEDLVIVEIREGSNTTWDSQSIIRKNTLEMFENLFSRMDEVERRRFQSDKVLKTHSRKLAIAYLIARNKVASAEPFRRSVPRPLPLATNMALMLVPASLIRPLLIRVWGINQRRSFVPVNI